MVRDGRKTTATRSSLLFAAIVLAMATSSSPAKGGIVYQNLDPSIGGITILSQDTSNPANTVSNQVGDIVTLATGPSSIMLEQFNVGLEYQGSEILNGTLTLRIWEYANNSVIDGDNPFIQTVSIARPFSSSFSPFMASFNLQGLNINITTPELAFLVESSNLTLGPPTVVTNTLRLTTNNNNPGPGSSSPDNYAVGTPPSGFTLLDSNFGGNINAQILATPEPSSLVFSGLIGLAAIGWRIRRSRKQRSVASTR